MLGIPIPMLTFIYKTIMVYFLNLIVLDLSCGIWDLVPLPEIQSSPCIRRVES